MLCKRRHLQDDLFILHNVLQTVKHDNEKMNLSVKTFNFDQEFGIFFRSYEDLKDKVQVGDSQNLNYFC